MYRLHVCLGVRFLEKLGYTRINRSEGLRGCINILSRALWESPEEAFGDTSINIKSIDKLWRLWRY